MGEDIFTVERVAELLELHPKTVRRFIREGRLKAHKMGGQWRVMRSDLSSFMGDVNLEQGEQQHFETVHTVQAYKQELKLKVQVSSVVDVIVSSKIEADRISTTVFAAMNSRGSEHGQARCDYLYYEKENRARFMLWGTASFMGTMLSLIAEISE